MFPGGWRYDEAEGRKRMEVFQCPDCDLRFRFASEMEQHISIDHPDFEFTPRTIEDSLLQAGHKRKHAPAYNPDED
jgi:hypothetical protein